MERIPGPMRQNGMMYRRQVRGIVVAGVLGAALAGCGTQVATINAGAPAASTTSTTDPPAVGCASVSQATKVLVSRATHLVEPMNGSPHRVTQRNSTLVRALFTDLCAAVTHPDTAKGLLYCPADFGVSYVGTFYDGSRTLASFIYGASGCPSVSLTVTTKTKTTLLLGNAERAAPHLDADLAAVLGVPKSQLSAPTQQINPGGPDRQAAS
jgi:hypothetical protein